MSRIELKPGIFIEGFDEEYQYRQRLYGNKGISNSTELLYQGKTNEISEELAKECAELLTPKHPISLWRNYKYDKPQPASFTKCTAKESIQSACDKEYCIIYKVN